MPLGPDSSYSGQSKIYTKQQPDGATLNGNTIVTEMVVDAGGCLQVYGTETVNGVVQPGPVAFTIAPTGAGGSNKARITIQMQDNGSQSLAGYPYKLDVCLSDASNGVGLTGTTASGGIAVSAGTLFSTYSASKAIGVQVDATGKIQVDITDTGKTGFYVSVMGAGLPYPCVSRQLTAADYS